tara:strand:- start:68 stop:235 length:168 start_codon:yes stop_codon:yes gene_type:complete
MPQVNGQQSPYCVCGFGYWKRIEVPFVFLKNHDSLGFLQDWKAGQGLVLAVGEKI